MLPESSWKMLSLRFPRRVSNSSSESSSSSTAFEAFLPLPRCVPPCFLPPLLPPREARVEGPFIARVADRVRRSDVVPLRFRSARGPRVFFGRGSSSSSSSLKSFQTKDISLTLERRPTESRRNRRRTYRGAQIGRSVVNAPLVLNLGHRLVPDLLGHAN